MQPGNGVSSEEEQTMPVLREMVQSKQEGKEMTDEILQQLRAAFLEEKDCSDLIILPDHLRENAIKRVNDLKKEYLSSSLATNDPRTEALLDEAGAIIDALEDLYQHRLHKLLRQTEYGAMVDRPMFQEGMSNEEKTMLKTCTEAAIQYLKVQP